MKFLINGHIKKGTKFEMEIDANSKSHAIELLYTKFGSKQGLKKINININEIKEMN